MADNQIKIDLLINAAESAKTIGEQRKALKDLQSALNQLGEGSDAFNQVAAAAGGLRDQMADLRAQTQFYADDLRTLSGLTEIGEGIAASFGLVQSGLEALGVGSESATEAIKKLQIAQTALNSLQAIGNLVQKESAANILLTNTLKKLGIDLTIAEGAAVEGLTVKQRILNLVQKASPMGILIGVVGALTAAYALFTTKTDEQVEAEKKAADEKKKLVAIEKARQEQIKAGGEYVAKEASAYIILSEQLSKSVPKSKERLELITKINATYGTTLKNLDDEKKFQDQVTNSLKDYINFLKTKYALQANEKLIQENVAKQYKLEKELAKEQAALNESIEARKRAGYKDTGRDLRIALELQYEVVDGLKAQLDAADKRLQGYVNSSLKLSEKIDATGLKTADNTEKTNTKITNNTKKALDTLDELYNKYADDLINAQLDLQEAQLKNDENYYNEKFAEFEAYNNAYLAAFNAQQDQLLNTLIAKNDEAEKEELASAQDRIDKVLAQYKKGSAEYQAELKKGEDLKLKIIETYDTKGQNLIQDSNKVKAQKEIEIQAKLAEIRENARQQDLADLQANLDLAESNLISYNQKVSVLLRKNQFAYKFPEASSPIQIKNVEQNVKALTEIQRLLNDETSDYGKELEAIYQRQRKGISDAVKGNQQLIEETKDLNLYDVSRGKLNIELNEVNKKQAEELYALVLKIQKEKQLGVGATQQEIELAKEFGDTTLTDTIKALEFTNKRVIIEEKVNALLKGQVGDREKLLIGLRDSNQISQEEYQLSIESVDTIKEFYRLLVQQNVVSAIYGESLKNHMKAEKLGVEYAKEKNELLFGQTVEIQTQNEELSKFLNEQSKSSQKINEILAERKDLLDKINQIQDPYEKEAQTIQTYLSTSSKIGDILQEDAKRFEDYGRSWVEKLFNTDNYETEFEKALLQLSGRLTSQLDIEKARFESERKKLKEAQPAKGEDPVAFAAGQKAQLEKLEKDHQNNLKKITEDGALTQVQIEEQKNQKILQGKKQIYQETVNLLRTSLDAYAEFASREADVNIAQINREREARLEAFDQAQTIEEMRLNNAETADYIELNRKAEVAAARQAIEDEYNAKAAEEKRKAFNAQKAAAVSNIVISTAQGVMQSFAQFGPVLGAILSGIIVAAAGVQTALVLDEAAPEFAKGGILDGPSHAQGGIKTAYGELEGGEAIINKKSTKMFAPMLSAINEAGGGVKFADGGTLPTTPVTMNNSTDFTEIKGMLREFANKPILTYVNESEVTRAQRNQRKIEKRTTF